MKYDIYEGTYACVKKAAITVRDMKAFVKAFSDGVPRSCKEMAKILYADFEEKEYMRQAYIAKVSQFVRHLMGSGLAGYIEVPNGPITVEDEEWVFDIPASIPRKVEFTVPSGKVYTIQNPEYTEYVNTHRNTLGHFEKVNKTIIPKPTRKYFLVKLREI